MTMTFAMPEKQYTDQPIDTAAVLRDLEQNAPNPTPKAIRAAMLRAAQDLDDWKKLADTLARELDEAANVRISEMASTSAVSEIQRGVKRSLASMAERLRAKL